MGLKTTYKARTFDLSGLTGISNETLAMHFKLYEGYVTNTNTLNEKIAELIGGGELDATKTAAFSELKRRFGFEYNGMVLHEYYFENMKKQGTGDPDKASAFVESGRGKLWQLRRLEGRFCRDRQDARRRLGGDLSGPDERRDLEPLDQPARDRQRRRLHADPDHGRLGARVYQGLRPGRSSKIYRGVFREYRLGHGQRTALDRRQGESIGR